MPNTEENCYSVYMHVSPSGKRYVGITSTDPEKRWDCGRGYQQQPMMHYAILKYGWANITHIVLLAGLDKATAEQAEIFLIENNRTTDRRYGYNISPGGNHNGRVADETKRKIGDANRGRHHTLDARERIRKSLAGRTRPRDVVDRCHRNRKPVVYTAEFREAARKRATGRKSSPGTRAKLVMALLGRPVTEKTRNKASASLKAFYTVPENRKKIIEGASKRKRRLFKIARSGEALAEFFSVKEAAKSVGCRPGCLVRAAKANETNPPRLRTAAGFVWRYAEAT